MATIQSLGIGSGLLTSELLESLLEAERAPVELRLDREQAIAEAKLSAFGEINSVVSELQDAMQALNSTSAFNASQVVSSNESALTATAASTADAGNYSIQIQQLAQQQTIATQAYTSVNEAIGTGEISFRFGTTDIDGDGLYQGFTANDEIAERSLVIDESNNTLAGIRDAVNAANFGVEATIVDDGSGFRLLFTSAESGADQSIELTGTGTAGLDAFNFNAGAQTASQTQAAQDALFTVNGLAISRSDNLVTGVIPGVTLNLKSTTTGPVSLGIDKDPSALMDKVQDFVGAYNGLKSMSDQLSAFDPDSGSSGQGSLLTGDTALRRMMTDINNTLRQVTSGATFSSLAEVGVTSDQFNDYQLTFDRSEFETAFATDPQAVTGLFAATGTTSDSQVDFLQAGRDTQAGSYDVEITRMAEVGRYQGVSVAALGAGNIVIDADNKDFTVLFNGNEIDISLTEGTYATAEELATELQAQINSNADVIDSEDSMTVVYNAAESRFDMSSNRYGEESVIRFTDISAEASSTLGLVLDNRGPFQGNQLNSLATTGGLSSDPFIDPLVIDEDTAFSLSINGISTGSLSLPGDAATPVTYTTPDELTAALQTQINDALAADGITVNVNYQYNADNTQGRLVFSTADAGDEIAFTDVNFAAASKLGLFLGTGAAETSIRGVDVEGTINGIEAVGSGQLLTASSGVEAARPGFYLNAAHGDLSGSTATDSFRVEVDGVLSGSISLGTLGNSSPETVAAAMQTAINNNPAMIAAGVGVIVDYDTPSGSFGIISNSTGASSSVKIAELQGNAGNLLGFNIGRGARGEAGQDASGEPDPSSGLRLRINGGDVGDRGTVDYTRGVADRMKSLIDTFLSPGGVLSGRQESLNGELEKIAERRVELDERMARSERRLQSSFTANDLIISRFNTTADFLTSQLDMLEALVTPKRE
ncbi:MAG: flagellar filament capping protein FliD [Pseudohongiella sp.]|uniref:flagellar filament capping protein FliD n=1 Tax=Pseudohongiella sp. TaxID=1979412 RepID=UPI0034A09406